MPFTFSHPLYAAPLKSLKPAYFSLTGLILGSMSPDFEYFIMLEPYQSIGHTVSGLLLQAIPLSVVLAFCFHYLIKAPLAAHLPAWLNLDQRAQRLIQPWGMQSFRAWMIFIISVIIGFYSHIVVDAFTHASGYFVVRMDGLQQAVLGLPIFKWLQYSLSMMGLLAEAIFVIHLLRTAKVRPQREEDRANSRQKVLFWFVAAVVALLTLLFKLLLSSGGNVIGMVVVAPITGGFAGILLASIIFKRKYSPSHKGRQRK
ncbi:DUF4184 family protein [Paenibacillus pinihumi]|uniref:DUF4184 family protein n=1 Tax=Paenibacillus pinihumi TaxID=669462 RepID=UPI000A9B4D70|nr:DUF4184 family protein [Paenibacillus pinihumi]